MTTNEEMYVAREKDGSLFLFMGGAPEMVMGEWVIRSTNCVAVEINSGLFPEINTDYSPVRVKLVKSDKQ